MVFPTIFSCRRIVVKVFLVQFIAFQATYAAPSPIIRFPGDDTPKTDKEVALVSLCVYCTEMRKSGESNIYFNFIFLCLCFPFSTIWISFMDAHKTDATLWCSRTPWRKCKSSSLCKKLEKLMSKLWISWKSPAAVSQMWPITTSSTGNPCGRRKTSLTGQGIYIKEVLTLILQRVLYDGSGSQSILSLSW